MSSNLSYHDGYYGMVGLMMVRIRKALVCANERKDTRFPNTMVSLVTRRSRDQIVGVRLEMYPLTHWLSSVRCYKI